MILKNKLQRIIQLIGLFGLIVGILTMLRTPTLIMPPWFLVLLYLPIVLMVSFLLGLAARVMLKNNWSYLTFTALFTGLIGVAFFISSYRPTHRIIVPGSFSARVRLFLSKDETDVFELNEYGIGYVSEATYKNGFQPEVEKSGKDITDEIARSLSFGSMEETIGDGKSVGPYRYLQFIVPGESSGSLSVQQLIERHAIDTGRLIKE